jgi:hypothetical protein
MFEPMPKHTRKKFVRDESLSGRLQIAEGDIALLKSISDFRFMNTKQIAALHHRGLRNLQRRLADLFHEKYLERPRWQKTSNLTTGDMVYSLGEQGVEFLFGDQNEERKEKLRQVKYDHETTFPHISHQLMISEFRATLTLALETFSIKATLSRWEQGRNLKNLLAPRGGKPELEPDAFFSIDTEKGRLNFFLEADRGSEGSLKFLDKMKTYWKWHETKFCEKTLGIARFRVLTITPDATREKLLRRTTKEADPLHEGKLMFLFASEKEFSLAKPEGILAPVWMSPKDEEKRALI